MCRQRLKRFTVPMDEQGVWESEKLWAKVSREIDRDDQVRTEQGALLPR